MIDEFLGFPKWCGTIPVRWDCDEDDEETREADTKDYNQIIKYLLHKINKRQEELRGSKGSTPSIEKQK